MAAAQPPPALQPAVVVGDTPNGYNLRMRFERTSTGGRHHVAEFDQPKQGPMSKRQSNAKAKAKLSLWPARAAAQPERPSAIANIWPTIHAT